MIRPMRSGLASVGMAVCLGLCVAAPASTFAWEESSEIGVQWVSFHYNEPGVMKEDGSMIGVYAAYAVESPLAIVRMLVSYDSGTILYKGGIRLDNGSMIPFNLDTPNEVVNARLIGGYKLAPGKIGTVIIPFSGIGYRFLYNDLGSDTPYGYEREQTYWYMPMGFETVTPFANGKWKWGIRAEYDLFIMGYNDSGGSHFEQEDGSGYQLSAFVKGRVLEKSGILVSFEPYYRHWEVGLSTLSADGYLEPPNSTSEYGMRAMIEF